MAKAPAIVSLKVEDFPALMDSSKGEAEKLFRALNGALTGLKSALDGNLLLTENARAFLKTLTLTAPVSVKFKNTLTAAPQGVVIAASADMTSGSAVPVALGGVAWTTSGDQVVVSDVHGTTSGNSYRLTFLVLGG